MDIRDWENKPLKIKIKTWISGTRELNQWTSGTGELNQWILDSWFCPQIFTLEAKRDRSTAHTDKSDAVGLESMLPVLPRHWGPLSLNYDVFGGFGAASGPLTKAPVLCSSPESYICLFLQVFSAFTALDLSTEKRAVTRPIAHSEARSDPSCCEQKVLYF